MGLHTIKGRETSLLLVYFVPYWLLAPEYISTNRRIEVNKLKRVSCCNNKTIQNSSRVIPF